MTNRTCATCVYHSPKGKFRKPDGGIEERMEECRKNPPLALAQMIPTKLGGVGLIVQSYYPQTRPEKWCGAWDAPLTPKFYGEQEDQEELTAGKLVVTQ